MSGLVRAGDSLTTLDLLGTTAHALLVFSGRGNDQNAIQKTIARIAPFNGNVHIIPILPAVAAHHSQTITDPNLQAHRRNHALRGALLLVRPDGYLHAAPRSTAPTSPSDTCNS